MKREQADLFVIPEHQLEMHKRLVNWAMWVRPGYGSKVHPMWANARSNARNWHVPEVRDTCDTLDASRLEKAVRQLPEKSAYLMRWYYVWCWAEMRVRRELGMTREGVLKSTIDARQMLINRL